MCLEWMGIFGSMAVSHPAQNFLLTLRGFSKGSCHTIAISMEVHVCSYGVYHTPWVLFTISESFATPMHSGVDSTDPGKAPIENNMPFYSVFFCIFMILGNIFVIQLLIGVIVEFLSLSLASAPALSQAPMCTVA